MHLEWIQASGAGQSLQMRSKTKAQRQAALEKRESAHLENIRHMSFWQLLGRFYRGSRDDLAAGLAGERMMPLDALLTGAPPAQGSIGIEMVLWQAHIDGKHPGSVISDGRIIAAVDAASTPIEIDCVRSVMPSQEPDTTFHRIDYWAAMLGDIESAKRLRAAYASARGLTPYFLEALEERARSRQQNKDHSSFRPGIGPNLLVRACEMSRHDLWELHSQMEDVCAWGSARRSDEADHADEAVTTRQDQVAMDAVGAAEDYLADIREEVEASKQRSKKVDKAQVQAADRFMKGLFLAWRDRFKAGETIDPEDARAAAEEVLVQWEKEQDRQIPIDLRDDAEVRRVLETEIDRQSMEAIRQENQHQAEARAKLALKDRSEVTGKVSRKDPMQALIEASDLSRDTEFLSPDDRQDAELDAAIAEAEKKSTAIQVLPHIDIAGHKADAGDILHQAAKLGGVYIEQTPTTELYEVRRYLVGAWPHAVDVIDRILSDLTDGQPTAFRPTILVGAPGSGKTSLLREIAEALDHPHLVYGCAGVCDSSFVGTSAQWGSKRLSVPLELIRQTGRSNPLVILDEIEKTGQYSNGGRLHDALLPLLEIHSASAFFEVGIERKANLSAVSYVATANSLEGISAPLKDRFRIVQMPDAGPEHIGDLAASILSRIIVERGLDRAWTPPLQPDEVDIIRKSWSGGSLRRLRRAVEATLDARESVLRRSVM